MIIAQQKKKENIAEYVLYMWQLEDLLRACQFDSKVIEANIISQFQVTEEVRTKIRDWYGDLIAAMIHENLRTKGHLQVVRNVVEDMNDLHLALMRSPSQIQYNTVFFRTLSFLVEFRAKSKASPDVSDVELALNMMYDILLLRLQHKEISEGTQKAVSQVSQLLAVLSAKYKLNEEGKLKLED